MYTPSVRSLSPVSPVSRPASLSRSLSNASTVSSVSLPDPVRSSRLATPSQPAPLQIGSTLRNLSPSSTSLSARPASHAPTSSATGGERPATPSLPGPPQVGSTARNLLRKTRKALEGQVKDLSPEEFQRRNLRAQELQVWQGILSNFSQMTEAVNSLGNHVSGLFDGINSLGTHVT